MHPNHMFSEMIFAVTDVMEKQLRKLNVKLTLMQSPIRRDLMIFFGDSYSSTGMTQHIV
jgi:hypothetical protein